MKKFKLVNFKNIINFDTKIPVYFEVSLEDITSFDFCRGWFSEIKPKIITCVMLVDLEFENFAALGLVGGKGTFSFVNCSNKVLLDFIATNQVNDVYGLVEVIVPASSVCDGIISKEQLTMDKEDVLKFLKEFGD